MAEDVDFEDAEAFAQKVETIKESYFTKKVAESADIVEEDDDGEAIIESSGSMAQYIQAIQRSKK